MESHAPRSLSKLGKLLPASATFYQLVGSGRPGGRILHIAIRELRFPFKNEQSRPCKTWGCGDRHPSQRLRSNGARVPASGASGARERALPPRPAPPATGLWLSGFLQVPLLLQDRRQAFPVFQHIRMALTQRDLASEET